MSDVINKIYDEMELEEVLCRLPSEFAISSVKRRITSAADLINFFNARDAGGASKTEEIKNHVNKIILSEDINDIFNSITSKYHPTLFGWLNDSNRKRILNDGKDKLTIEFLFNLTESNDLNGLKYILKRILENKNPQISKIIPILNKVDVNYFQSLVEIVIKDDRPKVKSSILSVYNSSNFSTISDHQKMIALKAFAKIPSSESGSRNIMPIDFKLFKSLKPLERIMALDRYLNYFPKYRKIKVFNPEPTKEEFDLILFAGCFEFNDLVEDIVKKYNAITKDDPPT